MEITEEKILQLIENGHTETIKECFTQIAHRPEINFELLKIMLPYIDVKKFLATRPPLSKILRCEKYEKNIYKFLIENKVRMEGTDCLYHMSHLFDLNSCEKVEMFNSLVELGADDFDISIDYFCMSGDIKIVELILSKNSHRVNIDSCFAEACRPHFMSMVLIRNLINITKLLLRHGVSKSEYNRLYFYSSLDLYLYKLYIKEFPEKYNEETHTRVVKRSPIWTMLSYREKVPRKSLLKKLPIDLYRQLELFI